MPSPKAKRRGGRIVGVRRFILDDGTMEFLVEVDEKTCTALVKLAKDKRRPVSDVVAKLVSCAVAGKNFHLETKMTPEEEEFYKEERYRQKVMAALKENNRRMNNIYAASNRAKTQYLKDK